MASLSLMTGAADGGALQGRAPETTTAMCCARSREPRAPSPPGVVEPRDVAAPGTEGAVLTDAIAAELANDLSAAWATLGARRPAPRREPSSSTEIDPECRAENGQR